MDEMNFENLPDPAPRRMVRLQKDKSTWLVFEIREQTHRRGRFVFHRADARLLWTESIIGLRADRIGDFSKTLNAIQVLVDEKDQSAKFGPVGTIRMSEVGCGLGTVLMSAVVSWLMECFPNVKVRAGTLSGVHATDENRDRRNRFYRKHGFDVVLDEKHAWGSFSKDRAGDLMVPESRAEILFLNKLVLDFAKAKSDVAELGQNGKFKEGVIQVLENRISRQRKSVLFLLVFAATLVLFPVIAENMHESIAILFVE